MPSPYVFFCYSGHDGALVTRLVTDLRDKGIHAWSEPSEVPGATAPDERARALQQAHAVVFVASPGSVAAPGVLRELEGALAAKRRVISLMVAPVPGALPFGLAHVTRVDLSEGYGAAFERLCALLAPPTTRATPTHAYYAYGAAPDPSAWSTFPESSSGERAARAHTPFPYVPSQRNEPARAGHSLEPVNASPAGYNRSRSSVVVVATACLAVAASVMAFVALVGGSTRTQRLGTQGPLPELGAGLATPASTSLLPTEAWLGSWRSACAPGVFGPSTWTTLTVEPTRLVAGVSDCDPDPPALLRFEWRLDSTRSRGDGLHELELHFERVQALPRRAAAAWNAENRFGRHDWVDGVPADIAPAAANPAFPLRPGDARHELAALRGDTLSLAASLSLALVGPGGARRAVVDPSERFTRVAH